MPSNDPFGGCQGGTLVEGALVASVSTAERAQISQRVCQQLHPIVPLLHTLAAQEQSHSASGGTRSHHGVLHLERFWPQLLWAREEGEQSFG